MGIEKKWARCINKIQNCDETEIFNLLDRISPLGSKEDWLIRSAKHNNLIVVTKLLECGADLHYYNDQALQCSVTNNSLEIVEKLLEYGANVHEMDNIVLRYSINHNYLEIVEKVLEYGANMHCCDDIILKNLQMNFGYFSKPFLYFNEQLADVLFPYCDTNDYSYFPADYIRKKFIPIKNAARKN